MQIFTGMDRLKLYYFSTKTLRFHELRWGKTKLALLGVLTGVALLWLTIEINQTNGDVLGIGIARTNALLNENRVLKEHLRIVAGRVEVLEKKLAQINEEGNQLRLLVDLPTIDEDTRKAGIGGVEDRIDFTTSADVNDLLNVLRNTVEKADRELQLQFKSYTEVMKHYETNKVKFARTPAIKPMNGYYAKKGFGMRLHPILDIYRKHEGLDIANDQSTPVYATADGTVELAGRHGGYGIMIQVNHGYGYKTLYAHLSKTFVRDGEEVRRGMMIGRSGNTGLSSGPHLHYEVRLNGISQNPSDYFFDDVSQEEYRAQKQINE
ncbi:MAG: M23 family metallopeptidase [Ignavibacteriales bacterium]|nr:M23 family metallopeptidase [Ignavibacteriales bacterium]